MSHSLTPLAACPQPLDHLALRGADEAPALVLRGQTLSYEDFRGRVARLSGWLRAQLPQGEARIDRAADAVASALEMADVFAQLRTTSRG